MNKIDITKKYQTRDGRPVRLYSVDAGGDYPVHGACPNVGGGTIQVRSWTSTGKFVKGRPGSNGDLIPVPEKVRVKKTVWLNVYPKNPAVLHPTREQADAGAVRDRLACVKHEIDIEVEIEVKNNIGFTPELLKDEDPEKSMYIQEIYEKVGSFPFKIRKVKSTSVAGFNNYPPGSIFTVRYKVGSNGFGVDLPDEKDVGILDTKSWVLY